MIKIPGCGFFRHARLTRASIKEKTMKASFLISDGLPGQARQ
jgi:hypothetical protein